MASIYNEVYARSQRDREGFWAAAAEDIYWDRRWDRVFEDSRPPFHRWFTGGMLNTCYNALDLHIERGRGKQRALIHDSPVTGTVRTFTFDKFGFQIAPLVAGIGVAGLGIGIALQGVLSNVVAGLTIIFTKPFRVGEFIELLGVHGEVVAIELFSTALIHPDRSHVIIPNRKIVGEILHNFGAMRQLTLTVRLPHDADLGAVIAAARAVTVAHPRVLTEPTPVIGVTEVGPLGVRLSVQPWVAVPDVVLAEAELYRALLERFRTERIGVTPALPAFPMLSTEEKSPWSS